MEKQFKNSVCAFLDILGFKKLTNDAFKEGKETELVQSLTNAIDKSVNFLENVLYTDSNNKYKFNYRIFTDNIIYIEPVNNVLDEGFNIFITIARIAAYQLTMALRGFFLRGGISIGPMYSDNRIILGTALIDAYETESKRAIYPRIIITPDVIEIYNKYLFNNFNEGNRSIVSNDILIDSDGLYFINYLSLIPPHDIYLKSILEHKNMIQTNLGKFQSEPHIKEKYLWAAAYHNYRYTIEDETYSCLNNILIETDYFSRSFTKYKP